VEERVVMDAALHGELVLVNGCLRVTGRYGDHEDSSLLIWPPDSSLGNHDGKLQIRDGMGQVVLRLGDEVYMGGGFGHPGVQTYLSQEVPDACPGPYWIVGDWCYTLTTYDVDNAAVLLVRQEPTEGDPIGAESGLTGKLVNADGCLRVQEHETNNSYLPLWPNYFTLRQQDGVVYVLDDAGKPFAQVGDEVRLLGGEATQMTANGVESLLLGRCARSARLATAGPFWVVSEILAAQTR
jgi:hypothetical protein